ncbi:MAG: cell division protein ZapA [Roseibaca calidilacus]|uniref:Cell division protein ZapA n=1 Tax=Roseibaca calidilacus TaxID=1666912 RepID=A0A0P7Z1R7_9RHOB|nr:cell division protein ZapA [Roseibaca calidilacus]KPP95620.1 MAG: cell division protein ZapA [Roseibaca calidilacus]CUX81991.1 cell division protein ZapA [Roseibaca calidilacus]
MPEQTITIGHKEFAVACQPGEEQFLLAAAAMLDAEARTLLNQIGRVPAERMLLMSGLMLADKTAAVEDKLKEAEAQIESMRDEISRLHARPAQKVEVPVVPQDLTDGLSELAARAEAVAEEMESRASS